MANSEIRAVLTKELYDHASDKAKAVGMTKAKWIAWLISQDMGKTSVVDVDSDRIAGAEAERILFRSEVRCLSSGTRVTWFDGYLWTVGKSANGYQSVLSRLMEYPQVLAKGLMDLYRPIDNKDVGRSLDNWNELKALDGIELLGERWFRDGKDFFNSIPRDEGFRWHKEKAIEAIKEAKEALEATAEATAALEVSHEEIAIEAPNVPLSPHIEQPVDDMPLVEATQLTLLGMPEHLTSTEFRTKFGLLDDGSYSLAVIAGRKSGYIAEDGSKWGISGSKKNRVWTSCPVALAETEDKVLSNV